MILIIRSNAIFNDPRVKKYISHLDSNNVKYTILGWDRNGDNTVFNNCIFFKKKSGYNVGGIKAAWNRVLWMWFCFKQITKINPSFIHGCDLDSVFPGVMYKILRKRKTRVLFDVFDWFSATLYNQPRFITMAFKCMEAITIKYSDHIIICEKERLAQIPYNISSKVDILPNIPMVRNEGVFKYKDKMFRFPNDNITVSYVGGLYNERFLDELLDIAERGTINLLIAGYGDSRLEEKCRNFSICENIKYFGGVAYDMGLRISYNSDIIYAMYCKTNTNHIYAAPNKYYEAMLLGKPIITTAGTIVGDKVLKHNCGFAIDENIEELKDLITYISCKRSEIVDKGINARKMWENKFSTYTQDFLSTTYQKYIKI